MSRFLAWWQKNNHDEGLPGIEHYAEEAWLAANEACAAEVEAAGCSRADQNEPEDDCVPWHFGNCPIALVAKLREMAR